MPSLRKMVSRFDSCRGYQFDGILDSWYDVVIMSDNQFFVPDSWEVVQHEAVTEEGSTLFIEFIFGDDEREVRFCIANDSLEELQEFIDSLLEKVND